MTNRIRSILEQREQIREDLLALSDDIWLSIDRPALRIDLRQDRDADGQ